MRLLSTTIGAYPKPEYIELPDWFGAAAGPDTEAPTEDWAGALVRMGDEAEEILARGTREVVDDQISCGIDIPSDGEIRRENYIHYHCRHLNGIDFERLTAKSLRQGAYSARLPTITGPVSARDHFLTHDWKVAQSFTDRPVKITMPGPMTIADTTANAHYDDPAKLGADLADALNVEVMALAEAGCKHIQIDEPVFARKVPEALDYGLENLERAFHGCPDHVVRSMHMCCGYPDALDSPDYPKAPKEAYFQLAEAVDRSSVMAVSLEDAHRRNDLSLLERFASTTVILGVIAIAKSRVESIDEVRTHLAEALEHIDAKRLIAAPDCGLGLLGRELTLAKLRILCAAARSM
ncbi:MAG: 5-methyltetrahydropteroyltriglutamate--homocysteine methyltransferase [Gammaproteobacteria bacterium]|nr:MAG: 5-methyltetrahydropteroyltriglutamate--homocysteine methyltransferase [Gammaproteobacteria bacterium]